MVIRREKALWILGGDKGLLKSTYTVGRELLLNERTVTLKAISVGCLFRYELLGTEEGIIDLENAVRGGKHVSVEWYGPPPATNSN